MSLVFFDEIMNILPYHFDDSSKRGWLIVKDQWPEKHGKMCCVSFLCDIVNQHPYRYELTSVKTDWNLITMYPFV